MAGKLMVLVGLGAGYVLGARAGRERYDQIAEKAESLWRDPRVQDKAGRVQQLVKRNAPGTSPDSTSHTTPASDGVAAPTAGGVS